MSEVLEQMIRQAQAQKMQLELGLRYKSNLGLLSTKYPDIARKLEGHSATKVLIKLDPNGDLNLLDTTLRQFFYQQNPQEFAQQQVTKFKQKATVRRFNVTKNEVVNEDHLHVNRLNALIDEFSKFSTKRSTTTPRYISNLIVAGIGSGHHLQILLEKFDIQNLFIYENCVDTFFASLHLIDWQAILHYFSQKGRCLTLSIGESPAAALTTIEKSISNLGLHALIFSYIYPHTRRAEDKDFLDYYKEHMQSYATGLGYFDDEQIGFAHAYDKLKRQHPVFVSNKAYSRQTPLIIIGNGPSLDLHQEYLRENADRAILMSCGSALGSLLKMGIKPDLHVEMERCALVKDFITFSTEQEQRKGITLLCLHTVSPETTALFDECCYAIKPNDAGSPLIHEFFAPQKIPEMLHCNPTVSNCGLSFAVCMGFQNIHFVGIDFGTPVAGAHHSKHSIYDEIVDHAAQNNETIEFFRDEDIVLSEGNFGGSVKSNLILSAAKLSMERYISLAKTVFPQLKIYNSNDGVKIDGTVSVKLADLDKWPQKPKSHELKSLKSGHFFTGGERTIEKRKHEQTLAYFYSIHDALKIKNDVFTESDLYQELNRIYSLVSPKECPTTHLLLRGSINCFFGSITEHSLYCPSRTEFEKKLNIARSHFNSFIDAVYRVMRENPLKLDATYNRQLSEMHAKRQAKNA